MLWQASRHLQTSELGSFDGECIPGLDKANRVRVGCTVAVEEDDDELLCWIVATNQFGRPYIWPGDSGCLHASNGKVARGCPGRLGLFFSDDKGAASAGAIELQRAAYQIRTIALNPVEMCSIFFCQCRHGWGRSFLSFAH